MGSGLNHPARLTFYKTFPSDDVSPELFEAFLKDQTEKQGASFVSYDRASGTWVIRVPHFTRYGLQSWDLARRSAAGSTRETLSETLSENISESLGENLGENLSESRAKIPRVAQPASKSLCEIDQEELQRLLSELRAAPLPFPEDSRGFSASLRGDTLLYSRFASIQSRSLPPSLSPFLQQPLRCFLDASLPASDLSAPSPAPQLVSPRGSALAQFLPRLQAAFESAGGASEYFSLFWALFALLFAPSFGPPRDAESPDASPRRRALFSRWLERLQRSALWPSAALFRAGDVFATAAESLLRHDVWAACEALRGDRRDRLAVQVAQISARLRRA